MSYSFGVRGSSKADVVSKVSAELDKVVSTQEIHSADRAQAQAAVEAFVGVVGEKPEDKDFYVSVSGSVGWNEDKTINAASVNVSVSFVTKDAA